ncbi:MAG: TIGR00730 family Rossman fold protein [Betaproteobacteria bacterium]|nr:TIGR00730 family Rossman fold protein [Betaproteobacteria bacterium]
MKTPSASTAIGWSLCVYCGSRFGDDPAYRESAEHTGRLLAQSGGGLVYGGGRVGLMGVVADAALAHGAPVVGVIPDALMRREVGHAGVKELYVVQTMHERKMLMADRSDAFLTLPGGIGTMEEVFEMWSWQQLGYHAKPVGLLNVAGYYNALIRFVQDGYERGFISPEQHAALIVDDDLPRLMKTLKEQALAARVATPSADGRT